MEVVDPDEIGIWTAVIGGLLCGLLIWCASLGGN